MLDSMYAAEEEKVVDHSPHNLFVELDELIGDQWVEQSRWIKYEEAREEGSERWGRPHVSSLSFHSLLNLRLSLEKGKQFTQDFIEFIQDFISSEITVLFFPLDWLKTKY